MHVNVVPCYVFPVADCITFNSCDTITAAFYSVMIDDNDLHICSDAHDIACDSGSVGNRNVAHDLDYNTVL